MTDDTCDVTVSNDPKRHHDVPARGTSSADSIDSAGEYCDTVQTVHCASPVELPFLGRESRPGLRGLS